MPGGTLNVDMSGTGYPMTAAPGNWMTLTIPATIQFHVVKFGIRNDYGQGNFWIGRTGLGTTGADAFGEADFGGGNEVWIIIDPSGPSTAAPSILTEAPKVVNVFNPWPTTAPVLALSGGVRKGMRTVAGNCGWFTAFVLKPAEHSFHIEEVNGADAYGSGGLGNRTPYNLTADFASKGATLWLDTDINAWLAVDPKKNRSCGYQMAAIVRDFSQAHADFDFGQAPDQVLTGMVEATLPANKKPVRTTKTSPHFNSFDDWFNTKAGVNAETCVDIPMTQSDNGMWMYDSYMTPEHGFYPIDNFTTYNGAANPHNQKNVASCYVTPTGNWMTGGPMHNMNFCMESHATFIYQKGQKFEFRGDDDVWVYINNKMVIDLGGLHIPKDDTVELDQLGLTPGQTYNWDFYYCERQPCGSSLKIKTSIYFKQQRALEAVPDPAKPGTFKIVKYSGGSGACGSFADSVKEVPVPPGSLVYKLWNTSGTELETLGEGSFHAGGIVIATPQVVVDTSKITDLAPGTYRVVAFEAASQNIRAEVPFTIQNRSWVQFDLNQDKTVPVGTLVPVVASNRLNDAAPAGVGAYVFTVNPASGLEVFGNEAKTVRVTAGASLATEANGLDTLWVTGDPNALTDVTYILAIPGSQRPVKITFSLPPLIIPKVVSATIHDDDADGIADRITATYDSSIAANLPKQVAYKWPASAAAVAIPAAGLAGKAAGPVLTLSGQPLGTGVLTSGQGVFTSAYPARGKDTVQSVPLEDRIAPVLVSAEMIPGLASDTLRLKFSEPIGTVSAAPGDLFTYRQNQAGADQQFPPTAIAWNGTRDGADLIFPAGAAEAPRSGNLVRIMDGAGRIADAAGNGAGANSRFRLITGKKRAEIATVTYRKIDPALLGTDPAAVVVTLEPSGSKVEEVVNRTGRLGHLVKVDLGDHAQADDFNPVDPTKVFLEYHVAYFTNHGFPVASDKKTLSCTDPLFKGDCRANRGYLFLGWDFTTNKKQRVATGAYIARLRYKVTVAGKTAVTGELDQTWGVLRSD